MRLFWKLFLVLTLTLMATASLSSWISRQWLLEDRNIETRLAMLASHAETAGNLLEQEGKWAYQRWLMHAMQSQHFRGLLVNSHGNNVIDRPVPGPIRPFVEQVMREQSRITIVHPPNLAVALPVDSGNNRLYWIAVSMMPRHIMQQTGKHLMVIQALSALMIIVMISWLLTRMFTRPIHSLQTAAEHLGKGALDTRTPKKLSTRKDELGDMARSFDAMATQLDALVSSHKQLLRDVSHELRSPLARLQVALELARNEAGDRAQEELERIGKETLQLNELIGEVLTLARFEQGGMQTKRTRLQLDKILREIMSDATFEAQTANKSMTFDNMESCPIYGDRIWLHRAFDNIIRNAIRHTDSGTAVSILLSVSGNFAQISICDQGSGVPPGSLPHLFEPFYRESTARERESGGYGLGLAIAQQVVVLHGGNIHASNRPNGGLEVRVVLPLAS